ncbi:MFS transporter [Solirubrobacter sp. CPCC 204708]|uniref:MFS transporter n=1 Tax=Solirubrobacter deserti TaxID=2282478 RepID=A0ABT4RJL7_9ACTN|nr:MFS transporter [Solirubrobacter deserti]MBE2319812.1 MFS transporter [Solirubrobacter deserti]MDA0138707.1 MFS transporter [Solirubrobacter deserti]
MPRSHRLILISMCVSLGAVVSAVSSLNVALPDLARATGASTTELQWIVDAYALVFAGLLLPAGALGDRLGRRRVLVTGLAVFGTGALVATRLSDPTPLIAVRAVMGLGAAMIMPTTLSIITATFPPETRDRAVGVWAGVAGGSALVGLLAAGLALERFAWPSVFGLNAALALLGGAMTVRFVPATATEQAPLDGVGAALSALGLGGIVYGFIEGPNRGWTSAIVVGAFAAGVVLLTAFVTWSLRRRQPMLDPRLFTRRGFASGSLSVFVQFFALFGVIFVLLQYLQFVLRYSPLEAGAALAPTALIMIALAPRVPKLVQRVGARSVGPLGLMLIAGGLLIAATMGTDASYWHLLAALIPLGVGMALAAPPATAAIVGALPEDKQGVASAVNDTAREVGGALGIAVLGSVLAGHVGHLGPHTDPLAVVAGFHAALHVGAATLIVGAMAVFFHASHTPYSRSVRRRFPV